MEYDGVIKEAMNFLKEAESEFDRGVKEKNRLLLQDACEKAWNAVVLATNYLVLKKTQQTVKSHYERRKALETLEKKDLKVRGKVIRDRFSARAHYLHEQGFYGGMFDEELIREEFKKVSIYIEDVKKLTEKEVGI